MYEDRLSRSAAAAATSLARSQRGSLGLRLAIRGGRRRQGSLLPGLGQAGGDRRGAGEVVGRMWAERVRQEWGERVWMKVGQLQKQMVAMSGSLSLC